MIRVFVRIGGTLCNNTIMNIEIKIEDGLPLPTVLKRLAAEYDGQIIEGNCVVVLNGTKLDRNGIQEKRMENNDKLSVFTPCVGG